MLLLGYHSTWARHIHKRVVKTHDETVEQKEMAGEMYNWRHSWTQRRGQTKPRHTYDRHRTLRKGHGEKSLRIQCDGAVNRL